MTTGTRSILLAALLTIGFLASFGAAIPARAQGADDDPADVLQRTEDLLRDIRVIVTESDSEQARRIFRDAAAKQVQAVQQLAADHPRFAVTLSLKARDVARQAERIARGSRDFQQRSRRYLERLQEMHQDVKDRAHEAGDRQAMTFVNRAENLFARARDQFSQTRYERSFRLLEEAEKALKRAARMLLDGGDVDGLEQEMERTANLIAVARERLGADADAALIRKLDQADRALGEARDALRADDPLLALRRSNHARRLAQQVLRQSGGAPNADAVEREFDRFDARQEGLSARAAEARDGAAARQLVRARGLRNDAGRALTGGRTADALRLIRSALNLQRQAAEQLP